jgi:hypothetical protein
VVYHAEAAGAAEQAYRHATVAAREAFELWG